MPAKTEEYEIGGKDSSGEEEFFSPEKPYAGSREGADVPGRAPANRGRVRTSRGSDDLVVDFRKLSLKAEDIKAKQEQQATPRASLTQVGAHVKDNGVAGDLGKVLNIMGGVVMQNTFLSLMNRCQEEVILFAYGYDRRDVTDSVIAARQRGIAVRMGFDRKTLCSGVPRDMHQLAQELESQGCEVRTMVGASIADEYRAVNRSAGGQGIQHAKAALVDGDLILGSCNWTTSSRSNFELCVHIQLRKEIVPMVRAAMLERLDTGRLLREDPSVAVRKPFEHRSSSRSASVARGGRSYSLDPRSQSVDASRS